MTERELSQARSLQAELDALRRVASSEPSPEVLGAIDRHARAYASMAQTCAWATDQIGQDSGLTTRLYVLEYLLSRRGTGPYRVARECKMGGVEMTISFIETSIKSYQMRRDSADARARKSIERHEYTLAAMAVAEAASHQAAINELEFLLESEELEA